MNLSAIEMMLQLIGTPAKKIPLIEDWADYFRADIPTSVCCANMVSACLMRAGSIPVYAGSVDATELLSNLRHVGWGDVADTWLPGDVFFFQVPGHGDYPHHVLMYAYSDAQGPVFVGMNNVLPHGEQLVCTTHCAYRVVAALRNPGTPSSEFSV